MIYKQFKRSFEPENLQITGETFIGPYVIIKDDATFQIVVSKDDKTIGYRIARILEIIWQNGSSLNYQSGVIVELPKSDVKPALTFLQTIAKDNMAELNNRFENSPEFRRFNLPHTDVVYTQANLDTVKQMWEAFDM